jgi:hypothetical protein
MAPFRPAVSVSAASGTVPALWSCFMLVTPLRFDLFGLFGNFM